MASLAKADLAALLRTRKLDTTLTDALPRPGACDLAASVATGFARLDARLGGGFRRGEISELAGARSSGRLSLLLGAVASAIRQGEVVALVDPLDMLDPLAAAGCGVDLAGLLWVRGAQISAPSPDTWFRDRRGRARDGDEAGEPLDRLVQRAVKAVNLVIQAGGFGLVALDVGEVPPDAVKRLPFTTWLRLERALEGSQTACVIVAREPTARSAGGVTVELRLVGSEACGPDRWARRSAGMDTPGRRPGHGCDATGGGGRWLRRRGVGPPVFLGLDVEARIIRARQGGDEEQPVRLTIGGETVPGARRGDPITGNRSPITDHR